MFLRKIGKKWYFTITITLENGEKKRIEKVGGFTKKEATEAAMQIIRKQDRFGRIKYANEMVNCKLKLNRNIIKKHYQ